jgi:hypothetical protein
LRALVICVLLFPVLVYPMLSVAKTQTHAEISEGEARSLLLLVVRQEGYTLEKRGMGLELVTTRSHQPVHSGYFDFSLTFETPRAGATEVLRLYAVSRRTGDVWETNLCQRYDFPDLKAVQKRIQQRTGYTLADEQGARQGLGCPEN